MAIHFGVWLHTRCMLEAHTDERHLGKGLAESDYQRVEWFAGDRREYETDRNDEHAWEEDQDMAFVMAPGDTAVLPCPFCPLCGQPPYFVLAGAVQAFCGNEDCDVMCWNPSETAEANIAALHAETEGP